MPDDAGQMRCSHQPGASGSQSYRSTRVWMNRADHEDPEPQPGHVCGELVTGVAGCTITGRDRLDRRTAVRRTNLITEIGAYGTGGSAQNGPRAGDPKRWDW